jgi:hypothetical protein
MTLVYLAVGWIGLSVLVGACWSLFALRLSECDRDRLERWIAEHPDCDVDALHPGPD